MAVATTKAQLLRNSGHDRVKVHVQIGEEVSLTAPVGLTYVHTVSYPLAISNPFAWQVQKAAKEAKKNKKKKEAKKSKKNKKKKAKKESSTSSSSSEGSLAPASASDTEACSECISYNRVPVCLDPDWFVAPFTTFILYVPQLQLSGRGELASGAWPEGYGGFLGAGILLVDPDEVQSTRLSRLQRAQEPHGDGCPKLGWRGSPLRPFKAALPPQRSKSCLSRS